MFSLSRRSYLRMYDESQRNCSTRQRKYMYCIRQYAEKLHYTIAYNLQNTFRYIFFQVYDLYAFLFASGDNVFPRVVYDRDAKALGFVLFICEVNGIKYVILQLLHELQSKLYVHFAIVGVLFFAGCAKSQVSHIFCISLTTCICCHQVIKPVVNSKLDCRTNELFPRFIPNPVYQTFTMQILRFCNDSNIFSK